MARRTQTLTIAAEGRDKGKTFLLTEMAAIPADRWATRVLLALAKSGVNIDEDMLAGGIVGLVSVPIKSLAGVGYADAEPLLDEMMTCVQIVEPKVTRALTPDDVEEVRTLWTLREGVLSLHLGFSLSDGLLKLKSLLVSMAVALQNTPTSPPPLDS